MKKCKKRKEAFAKKNFKLTEEKKLDVKAASDNWERNSACHQWKNT